MKRRVPVVSAALLATGLALFGHGAWIYAKAGLAQILLHRAWSRTLAGERQVKPWPWADTWPVARLAIPSAGGDFIVLSGASGRTLAFGPGHLDGTALPGNPGNCVLSAHRDTQFAGLRRLASGDAVFLETREGRRLTYRVKEAHVVDAGSTRDLDPTPDPTLTLITCYPFDAVVPGGRLRYVVRAVRRNRDDGASVPISRSRDRAISRSNDSTNDRLSENAGPTDSSIIR